MYSLKNFQCKFLFLTEFIYMDPNNKKCKKFRSFIFVLIIFTDNSTPYNIRKVIDKVSMPVTISLNYLFICK